MTGVEEGRRRLRRHVALAAAVVTALLLGGAGTAVADTATISITTTTGASDPAADVPRIFTVSGNTSVSKWLYVKYRAPGGAPCAPSAASDSGYALDDFYADQSFNGDFRTQKVITWSGPGTRVFCIWLANSSEAPTTPITQAITFRAPVGTVTATIDPPVVQAGQRANVVVTGSTETPGYVYAKVRAAGAACEPTYESGTGSNLFPSYDTPDVNGAFSLPAATTQTNPGHYVICLWLAQSASDTTPIAGPQPAPFTVAYPPPPPAPPVPAPVVTPPPPPCTVPKIGFNKSLARITSRRTRAHCSLGRVVRVHSRRVRRGAVVRLSLPARTKLAAGARVTVVVSRGPKPRRARRR